MDPQDPKSKNEKEKPVQSAHLGKTQPVPQQKVLKKTTQVLQRQLVVKKKRPKTVSLVEEFQDRKVAAEVLRYVHAAFRVLLEYRPMQTATVTSSISFPEKFLAPDKKGRARFATEEEARAKGGTCVRMALVKKCPQGDTVATLRHFVAQYRNVAPKWCMSRLSPQIFNQIDALLAVLPSPLRATFSNPYYIKPGVTFGKIIKDLQKTKREQEWTSFVATFTEKYRSIGRKEFSTQLVAQPDINKILQCLTQRGKRKLCGDLRKELLIRDVVAHASKILENIDQPSYTFRLTAKLFLEHEDWARLVNPQASLGIIVSDDDNDIEELKTSVFAGFWRQHRDTIADLVTGRFMVLENARDMAQKSLPGSRTQDLEDLLLYFPKLKEKGVAGPKYPDIEGSMKTAIIFSMLWALNLFVLAIACFLSGKWIQDITSGSMRPLFPALTIPYCSSPYGWDITAGILAIGASTSLWLSWRLYGRKGRLATILYLLLSITLCVSLLVLGGGLGYVHLPWLLVAGYLFYVLARPTATYHFLPEFGPVYAPCAGKIGIALTVVALLCASIYLVGIGLGYWPNTYALEYPDKYVLEFLHRIFTE